MLGALAGGEAMEIIVALKDLSAGGFRTVESNITKLERHAGATNLSGFSKAAKTVEKDAEAAAGKSGGGGIAGLGSGLVGLAGGPVTIAIAAIAGLTAAGIALTDSYDKIEVQEKAIAIAAKDHGIAAEDMAKHVENATAANVQYGFSASDTRGAIAKLTEAGMSLEDQQSSMGHIMDLARAKNLSLTDTSRLYELALMGNARALKDLGIALPKVTTAQAEADKAAKLATKTTAALHAAKEHLASVEAGLAGKTHLTAAEHLRLKLAHDKVHAASLAQKAAHEKLGHTMGEAALKAERLKLVNDGVTKAVDGQRNAVSPLQVAQARLGSVWERLAKGVGPGLEDMFTRLINGLGIFLGWVIDVTGAVGDKLGPVFGWLGNTVLPMVVKAFDVVANAVRHVIELVAQAVSAIANSPVGTVLGGAGGIIGNVAGAAHLASGGIVDRPTFALLGEGGEREYVIPESKMAGVARGAGGVFHAHLYLDGEQIADAVSRRLDQSLALAGTSTMYG
jgi:hypothetical protein